MKVSQLAAQYVTCRHHQTKDHRHDVMRAAARFIEANGDMFIGDITAEHISKYLATLGNYVKSSHSLKHYLGILKAILTEGMELGLISRLPRFPKIQVERRLPDAWTLEETEKLLQHVATLQGCVGGFRASTWWQSLLLASYYTGLRLSGLMSVTWFQVDLQGGFIRALTNKNKREQLFAIPPDLGQLLCEMKDPPREKVWIHPYHEDWPFKKLRKLVDQVGIPAPRSLHGQLFHKMRRTCITWTAVKDLNLATRVAGHASPETTIKHYVDPRMLGAIKPVVPQLEVRIG